MNYRAIFLKSVSNEKYLSYNKDDGGVYLSNEKFKWLADYSDDISYPTKIKLNINDEKHYLQPDYFNAIEKEKFPVVLRPVPHEFNAAIADQQDGSYSIYESTYFSALSVDLNRAVFSVDAAMDPMSKEIRWLIEEVNPNLIKNGDFSENTNHWNINDSNGKVYVITDEGLEALYLSGTTNYPRTYADQTFPVEPNKTYLVTFETRTEGTSGDEGKTSVEIFTDKGDGRYTLNMPSTPISSRDGYTAKAYMFTTEKNTRSAMIKIANLGINSGGQKGVFIRNIIVKK